MRNHIFETFNIGQSSSVSMNITLLQPIRSDELYHPVDAFNGYIHPDAGRNY